MILDFINQLIAMEIPIVPEFLFICCIFGPPMVLYAIIVHVTGPRAGEYYRDSDRTPLVISTPDPAYTTLNAIRERPDMLNLLLSNLGKTEPDDEPLSVIKILEVCGPYDAIWALRTVTGEDARIRKFLISFGRRVAWKYFGTHRWHGSRNGKYALEDAFDVAKRFIIGRATDEDLKRARMNSCDELAYALTSINPAVAATTLVEKWKPPANADRYTRNYAGEEIYEEDLIKYNEFISKLFYKEFAGSTLNNQETS